MKPLGWLLLAAYVAYKHTWGACECDGLRRRLVASQRQADGWESIAREEHHEKLRLRLKLAEVMGE